MKKKTFFTTMLLFLLFFNGAFLFLAVVFWHEKLDVQKEMALSEHYMILTSAARDMQALDSRGNGGNYNMEELMQLYTVQAGRAQVALSVSWRPAAVFR